MKSVLTNSKPLKGEITVGPDKSISHRGVILSSVADGEGIVKNYLHSEDIFSTINCMNMLGVDIKITPEKLIIKGKGLNGLKEPNQVLDCGNSGTTMRLLSGVLASNKFFSVMSGDSSLNNRPMKRVIEPLKTMGVQVYAREDNYAPIAIQGSEQINGIEYRLPVASAQVKSSLILAGLKANSPSTIIEPAKTRDHTERMLKAMGADINQEGLQIKLNPVDELKPQEFIVPADISSAAFFIVAALIVKGSELKIREVGINSTRAGLINVLLNMGANIKLENEQIIGGEPVADIIVSYSQLKATDISGDIIPTLIDELPILAVAMATAEGESKVTGASELRVKETDRIKSTCSELQKIGVNIKELEDGFTVKGPNKLKGATVESYKDHRIAMSLAIAALIAEGEMLINDSEAVSISFPEFWDILNSAIK
ncbi:3-phosphoshikimate 1-carboxyvinyltransferase [Candidatus Syntrophocurvum alkaliphilum]|uniref:3-phosphoshikimate 1-carboxyvinyltransferase n=1 Tax=Candidatus Syntrophocurvum alkaliphilum TaxID=2293317 RepID=A0A6I6DHQ5_9FIRM|nr:3-phosphoshikimate 1-carboxyvinyltransferase [Candidatus Syntrophocurvum alkaliphilum]QGT99860.1 3-phosphoshikimate 1-carboxyvinyltransferase [Candidatus Syntrophocurvum alkaliphilum]